MPYKTINVNPETYDRFVYYKHANMTFDDVLNEMMNKISEEEFYEHVLEEHKEEIRKMKEGDYLTEDELDNFLDSDDEWSGVDFITYELIYSKKFAKGLKDIIKSGKPEMRERVKQVLSYLKEDPHMKQPNVDIKLISSREEGVYRVRIGDLRMTYEIDEEKKLIMITKIFPRGKGYWKWIAFLYCFR